MSLFFSVPKIFLKATSFFGGARAVVDRSDAKTLLVQYAQEEVNQMKKAQQHLAKYGKTRLSDLGELSSIEFHLFLDLLGEALSQKSHAFPNVPAEALSTDGSLCIVLESIPNAPYVTIQTADGQFSGLDHNIQICETFV